MAKKAYGSTHTTFLLVLGIAGWATVTWLTLKPAARLAPWSLSWELGVCFALGILARFLAFPVYRRVRVALDSVFYVAARFVFGTVPAAWVVLAVLTLDALVRMLRGSGPARKGEAAPLHNIAQTLYSGGLPALIMVGVGSGFGDIHLTERSTFAVLGLVASFSFVFLIVHYFFAGAGPWFEGTRSRDIWREFFLRMVGAELALAPLSLAMVLAYRADGMLLFGLLGATGLLFNAIFKRWAVASDKLAERFLELNVINRVGRAISGSLDRESLFQGLAVTALELVGHSSRFLIGLSDDTRKDIDYKFFNAEGVCYKELTALRDAGLSGWVLKHREGLLLGNVNVEYGLYVADQTYNDTRFHSWLGVPLIAHDEVVGVMSVQSEHRDSYTLDHMRVLTIIADQAAVAIENSRLYQLATIDGLTGLFVRRYFDQRLVEECDRAQRYESPFSIGLFDLDHFKLLNDTYGHQVGDQVLRAAAKIVRQNMRSFDVAARYGGEEFVFILPRTGIHEAEKVAERIRRDIANRVIETTEGRVHFSTSIGLASYPAPGVHDADDLVGRADQALYRAKSAGRNRIEIDEGALGSAATLP